LSHFYNRKSYTFAETDEMLTGIKKEISNFLTKEEAELMINRRNAIIDPSPYWVCDCREHLSKMMHEIDRLNNQIQTLNKELDDTKNKLFKCDTDEPTI
jgi:peptidoglycan hydrolase CwlO-like protein